MLISKLILVLNILLRIFVLVNGNQRRGFQNSNGTKSLKSSYNHSKHNDRKSSKLPSFLYNNYVVNSSGIFSSKRLRHENKTLDPVVLSRKLPIIKRQERQLLGDTKAASKYLKVNNYYFKSDGITFLKKYGSFYGLFDQFKVKFKNQYGLRHERRHQGINETYLTRSYKNYHYFEYITQSDISPYINDRTHFYDRSIETAEYIPEIDRNRSIRYNNRLRFGTNENERFIVIAFSKDPWEYKDAVINLVPREQISRNDTLLYYCQYTYPVATEFLEILFLNNSEICACPIPPIITDMLNNKVTEIRFNFASKVVSASYFQVLLSNIIVRRLHELDRRHFNVSVSCMISNLEDPLLREWLVYHLAIGVEHFYLFDNRKIFPIINNTNGMGMEYNYFVENSTIKPFLDANLITLIYHPFIPTDDFGWNSITQTAIQAVLQQFGYLNKWIGLFDNDEFFLPSPDFQELYFQRYNNIKKKVIDINNPNNEYYIRNSILSQILDKIEFSSKLNKSYPEDQNEVPIASIWFNTLEMGCENEKNFYLSTHLNSREAQTTTCYVEGVYFKEYEWVNDTIDYIWDSFHGHGKIFVKPENSGRVESPHLYYRGKLGLPQHGGMFYHYNNLKYSKMTDPAYESKNKNYKLNNFANNLFDHLFGLKI